MHPAFPRALHFPFERWVSFMFFKKGQRLTLMGFHMKSGQNLDRENKMGGATQFLS